MRSQASEFREGCRLHPYPVRLCKVDCQQCHLDWLVVECLPYWRKLKGTFEEYLTSWWGRTILFKFPFQLIVLVHSHGMEGPQQFTRPVRIALFTVTHCWFSVWQDRIIELVTEEVGHIF